MSNIWRIAIIAALLVAVAAIVIVKKTGTVEPAKPSAADPQAAAALPRLLELGSDTCIPCRQMAPVLDELRKEYAGKLQVDFIDVRRDPDAARKHGILVIPTQIFFDAAGNEVARHEGFFAKNAIIARFREAGVDLSAAR